MKSDVPSLNYWVVRSESFFFFFFLEQLRQLAFEMAYSDAILFYSHKQVPYGCFSNFSEHSVVIGGQCFPTTEHYFQAMKFAHSPHHFNQVAAAATPTEAKALGCDRRSPLRPDWEEVKDSVMFDACLAKFTQHEDLKSILLGTGEALLVEHTTNDRYWGDGGAPGKGKNMLGQTLMAVRETVRRTGLVS
jgi:ribA/ribD-fused uncharacterized protein